MNYHEKTVEHQQDCQFCIHQAKNDFDDEYRFNITAKELLIMSLISWTITLIYLFLAMLFPLK